MKLMLTLTAIILVLVTWTFPAGVLAQEAGECYFEATEDIYLKIYNLDKDGVERWEKWSGHLAEGGKKSFHAPNGQVGYAVKKKKNDPWEESQEDCYGGDAIQVP